MTISNLNTNKLLPAPSAPALVGFTSSTTYVVPAYCTQATILVVGGGRGGSYTNGGDGATPTTSTVGVIAGESLTITVGAGGAVNGNGTASVVSGSFGSVTGAAPTTASQTGNGAQGTFVTNFGWFGGSGGANGEYRGGRPGGGHGNIGAGGESALANTGGAGGGAGGGPGAGAGGSGYVAIFVR